MEDAVEVFFGALIAVGGCHIVSKVKVVFAWLQMDLRLFFFGAAALGYSRRLHWQAVRVTLAHVDQLGAGAVPRQPDTGRGDTGERDRVGTRVDAIGNEKAG